MSNRADSTLLADLRAVLAAEHNVRFALLYGSVGAGMDTPDSDVDVLVDLREVGLDHVLDVSERLATASRGRSVDVVGLADAEVDPLFLADVLVQGRVLVDRDELWPGLRRREPSLRRHGREQEVLRTEAALAGIDRMLASGST